MVRVLAVDAAFATARAATILRHEVRREVDVGELARLIKVEPRALEGAVRVRGAVVEFDGVAVGLVRVPPHLAVGGEEV